MDHSSDFQLLQQTPGTPAAFDEFYRRHERLVLAYFMRRCSAGFRPSRPRRSARA